MHFQSFAQEFQHMFPSDMYQNTLLDAPPSPTPQTATVSGQHKTQNTGRLTPR